MPYPPPPGPPDVGEFQAIGLLPAPQLPDVTGNAGKFLETDGIIPQWEPVTGVLPDQTGHGGQFLTTDGVAASWSAVSGVLPDQTGQAGKYLRTDGTAASWASLGLDVTDYGAVPDDTTKDFGQAWYNTIAAWIQNNTVPLFPASAQNPVGNVILTAGKFYTSMPLCMLPSGLIAGQSTLLTTVSPGVAATGGSNVPTFAGPVLYAAPPYTPAQLPSSNFPSYDVPLVGATGQSLTLHDSSSPFAGTNCLPLHDAWPWGTWIGNTYNINMSLQFWVRVDDAPPAQFFRGIIGSRGPDVWSTRTTGPADVAFGVYAVSDGVTLKLQAFLTTSSAYDATPHQQPSGTVHVITSSAITPGTAVHVELDYNGSFFDFYVGGVNQGHVSAVGGIVRAPWEGTQIGGQGPESIEEQPTVSGINGAIDSIRLSNIARHTGAGSFTPPSSKYTWDSNTYALYNWDQGVKTVQPVDSSNNPVGPLLTLPFLVGQSVSGTSLGSFMFPPLVGPVPHYIRLIGSALAQDITVQDLTVCGWQGCSGILTTNAPKNLFKRVWVTQTTQFGLRIGTGVSFYVELEDIQVQWCAGTGILYFGDGRKLLAGGCGIGVQMPGGNLLDGFNNQPAYNSYCSVVFTNAGPVVDMVARNCTYDAEAYRFTRQIAVGVNTGGMGSFVSENNSWVATSSASVPFLYFGTPADGCATHINDQFFPNPAGQSSFSAPSCSAIAFNTGVPSANILLINPLITDQNVPPLPISNISGWVSVLKGAGSTNARGLSISDTPANNLAGTFIIQGSYTQGGPVFTTPEPDTNYQVVITPQDSVGGSPASGAETIVFPIIKRTNGFTATVKTAPGGSVQANYAYQITRVKPPPLYFSYLPTLPSSITNPLSGTGPFAVGVTIVPGTGNLFVLNATQPFQSIIEAGVSAYGTDWWEISIENQSPQYQISLGASAVDIGARVVNGHLLNFLNPGAHNVALYYDGLGGYTYLDGQGNLVIPGPVSPGTQQTPIYIGKRTGTTDAYSTGTLRNLKIDTSLSQVITFDSDIGPGTMTQGAFFGDEWSLGYESTTTTGGFAQQIAQARYGTTYYWMAAINTAVLTGPPGNNNNILTQLWSPWQGASTAPQLTGLCILAGWYDILNGTSAADIFAALKQVLEGTKATNTFIPPTSTTTPTDQHAFAVLAPPRDPSNPGTAVFHIGGFPISSTFNTDGLVTANALIVAINADVSISAIVTPSLTGGTPATASVTLSVKVAGTAGNGIAVTCDGGAGAFCYGDVGGVPSTGLNVVTFGGVDTTCVIAGVSFPANFDTDAATTVNNLVNLVNADVTVSALVTASNVANQMLITANTAGYAGNAVTTTGSATNTPGGLSWVNSPANQHMTGGSNGAITNGIGTILLCNVPPIGTAVGYTAGKETQRGLLNASIAGYVGAGVSIVDVDGTVRDPAAHVNLNPTYDTGNGYLNDAGHTAMFGLINPLLP